jgi:hypothetical protein
LSSKKQGYVCFPENDFGKLLSKFSCVCLLLEKLINGKHFPIKENLAWFPGKCFPFILGEKHFPEVMKNLEMSYYLLIISNLVKLLIALSLSLYIYIYIYIYIYKYILF